ncbi:hypothetical protein CDL12_01866 [Handroanthus impetiginosus]|uniref:RING-CH-type domain-containing protein n=1 Tax=Handroanthus impetiginosus TaxID=429701 RepID=A0A2G9I6L9_9LAMI|nr:hypothetical protein CDL12_01866 [Handroanthus impetiginosus]
MFLLQYIYVLSKHARARAQLGSMEEMTSEDISILVSDHPTSDETSERNVVTEANAISNAKEKELVDPITAGEKFSILDSKHTSEKKSSESNLTKDETQTCSTPSTVELKAKEKAPLDLKSTSDEKSSSVARNRNKRANIPSSKVNTSSISSRVKLEEKNQRMETQHDPIPRQENRSPKLIYKVSIRRSQQGHPSVTVTKYQPPTEEPPTEESQTEEPPIAEPPIEESQTEEPPTNPEGGDAETIYKGEAICKNCYEPMFDENNVLQANDVQKAKCKCRQLALIHANCAQKWEEEKGSRCLACEEQIRYIPVTLTIVTSDSSPQETNNENPESPGSSCCCFYFM